MRITVLGAGYVGLVTGACLAAAGHRVALVEPDAARHAHLAGGRPPFFEPGLESMVGDLMGSGALSVARDPDEDLPDADLIMICVGTPLGPDGAADLSQVETACAAVAEHAPSVPVTVRSTLPLGSTSALASWLRRPDLAGTTTNPEFLRQGTAIADFQSPSRIVVGTPEGTRTPAVEMLIEAYRHIEAPLLVTTFTSADMIKNAANAFLATKLSFVNEISDLCEAYGADIEDVVAGIGLDPRIGSSYLRPGIGFGGSCLPKELANMVRLGRRRGLAMPLLAGAAATNEQRATRIVDRLEELLGPVRGSRVALLGLAFKAGTDDLRYAPALALAATLLERGAEITAYDPAVPGEARADGLDIRRAPSADAAIAGSDLAIIATEWPEFASLEWERLAGETRRPVVYDGRGLLEPGRLAGAGWRTIRVGHAD